MTVQETCAHVNVTIAFRRNGTRLHPNVWMEEVCLDCGQVLDHKKLTRGQYAAKGRDD
jgi:hypothetical protein